MGRLAYGTHQWHGHTQDGRGILQAGCALDEITAGLQQGMNLLRHAFRVPAEMKDVETENDIELLAARFIFLNAGLPEIDIADAGICRPPTSDIEHVPGDVGCEDVSDMRRVQERG